MDMTRLRHVQNGGVYHAEQDRDRQVKDDRCEHRDQKLADTGLELVAEDVADALPVVHAPRRDHQHTRERRGGRRAITPPSRNIEASRNSEWNTLVRRVCWPDLTATLVRAMAAVAGTPPKAAAEYYPRPVRSAPDRR